MPLLLLIRHGENEFVKKGRLAGRLSGVHLNETGLKQVRDLADRLATAPIKAVYSSPLERAVETATPLAERHSLPVIMREGLTEIDSGEWQGMALKDLRKLKLWKMVQGSPSRTRFPGGETFSQAQLRICQELEAIGALHDLKDIIICVSHADPIKLAAAFFIGLPLDNFQRLHVSPASITALNLGKSGASLFMLNYDISLSLSKS